MIKNESEYKEAVERYQKGMERVAQQRVDLAAEGLKSDEVERVVQPVISFHEQLKDEITTYERIMRQDFETISNFQGIGRLLIALRISLGWSQKELAEALEVDPSQVSRDERNEYHGITMERANRIIETLGVTLKTTVVPLKKPTRKPREQLQPA